MKDLLKKFENKTPEIVFEWNDSETEAQGWLVINSLRGGAAGGGTRMRVGLDKREVESLAKTMEVKFVVSGPAIGGAKSGINFDPNDPRKAGVLNRWYRAVAPLLKNYYGTGGDLNVDEIHEVIPITEKFGVWHPQEGVLEGHYEPNDSQKIKKIGQLRTGVKKIIENPKYSPEVSKKFVIADMITGYGVAESVKHYYNESKSGNLKDKRIIIQGWGNVGSAAGFFLAKEGAKVIGIIDRDGGLINTKGYNLQQVTELFLNKDGNKLNTEVMLPFNEVNNKIWDIKADVFLPCAASRLVTKDQLNRMISSGVEVISAGANVPFADKEIFYGPIAEHADNNLCLIPDFISNCGMARVFAYLMQDHISMTDEAIFKDTSDIIKKAVVNTLKRHPQSTLFTKTAFEIALEKLL
tara:strand:+ start:165 stop:1394 length:1230 start_codon:yes stop_codon:yes gene_type:complete